MFQALRLAGTAELVADSLDEDGVAQRVEPDVDVAVFEPVETRRVEKAEDVVAVSRGVLELRLEALAEQQDEICVPQLPDVSGRRLEVVRLCSGRREVANVHGRPADLLRGKRERIERRGDARSLRSLGAPPHRRSPRRTAVPQ